MRKRLTFQILISTMIAIIVLRIGYTIFDVYKSSYELVDTQKIQMNWVLESVFKISDEEKSEIRFQRMQDILDGSRLTSAIDFYQVEYDGKLVAKSKTLEAMDTGQIPEGVFSWTDKEILKKQTLGPLTVVIGHSADPVFWFKETFRLYWHYMLVDILLFAVVIYIVFQYKLEILSSISRTLSQLTPKDLENINHPSLEIRTIVNFLRAFIDQHFQTEEQKQLVKQNLADGILHELFTSKQKPPYEIQVVLVRFDMNNYTRRALSEKPEVLTKVLSDFFRKVKELRHRYGGLDYQFIGDEKVLYFKINNPNEKNMMLLRASAFIRDVFSWAAKMKTDFPFTFKAAIVPGTLLFYELDGVHYFTGTPLIESARYLSVISEKEKSVLTTPQEVSEQIQQIAQLKFSEKMSLKGFDRPIDISFYDEFVQNFQTDRDPTLFLSDFGLVEIQKKLIEFLQVKNLDGFFGLFNQLRGVRIEEVSVGVPAAYTLMLDTTLEKYGSLELDNKVLSSVISLSWVFVPVGAETGDLKDKFYSLIRHKDTRVASNALMASQRYEWNEGVIEKMLNSPSNRLRGDALVLLGRKGIDQRFFKAWKNLIENSDMNFILSGLWASQEIFKFHSDHNPTHLKTNPLIENMVNLIKKLEKDSRTQVNQRAKWALESIKLEH